MPVAARYDLAVAAEMQNKPAPWAGRAGRPRPRRVRAGVDRLKSVVELFRRNGGNGHCYLCSFSAVAVAVALSRSVVSSLTRQ